MKYSSILGLSLEDQTPLNDQHTESTVLSDLPKYNEDEHASVIVTHLDDDGEVEDSEGTEVSQEGIIDDALVSLKDFFTSHKTDMSGFVDNERKLDVINKELNQKTAFKSDDIANIKLSRALVIELSKDDKVPKDCNELLAYLESQTKITEQLVKSYLPFSIKLADSIGEVLRLGAKDPVKAKALVFEKLKKGIPDDFLSLLTKTVDRKDKHGEFKLRVSDLLMGEYYFAASEIVVDGKSDNSAQLLMLCWKPNKDISSPGSEFTKMSKEECEKLLESTINLNKETESLSLKKNVYKVGDIIAQEIDRFYKEIDADEINKDKEKIRAANFILNAADHFAMTNFNLMADFFSLNYRIVKTCAIILDLNLHRMK